MSFNESEYYIIYELVYKFSNECKTKLFGKTFVNENKGKCKIIYNENEYYITENIEDIDQNYEKNKKIKIELIINTVSYLCVLIISNIYGICFTNVKHYYQ